MKPAVLAPRFRPLSVQSLEDRRMFALEAELVKDINPGEGSSVLLRSPYRAELDGLLLFSADNGA